MSKADRRSGALRACEQPPVHATATCWSLMTGGQEPKIRSLCSIEMWGLRGLRGEDWKLFRRGPETLRKRPGRAAQEAQVTARVQHPVLSASIVARALGRLEVLRRRLRMWACETRNGDPEVWGK